MMREFERAVPTVLSSFDQELSALFRKLGCVFSGDKPGIVLEQMAAARPRLNSPPDFQRYVQAVRDGGYQFDYSDAAERAFASIWRLLGSSTNENIVIQNTLAAMRVFSELLSCGIKGSGDAPFEVLEAMAARDATNGRSGVAASDKRG
jgi:hypothetical protein